MSLYLLLETLSLKKLIGKHCTTNTGENNISKKILWTVLNTTCNRINQAQTKRNNERIRSHI